MFASLVFRVWLPFNNPNNKYTHFKGQLWPAGKCYDGSWPAVCKRDNPPLLELWSCKFASLHSYARVTLIQQQVTVVHFIAMLLLFANIFIGSIKFAC